MKSYSYHATLSPRPIEFFVIAFKLGRALFRGVAFSRGL